MKIIVLFAALTVVLANVEYYTTGDDYINVDAVIADVPRLKAFSDCFRDVGPCDELSQSYKDNIPEAILQACKRCNPPQKHIFGKFLDGLKRVLPEDYKLMRQESDPENKYFDALEEELSGYF